MEVDAQVLKRKKRIQQFSSGLITRNHVSGTSSSSILFDTLELLMFFYLQQKHLFLFNENIFLFNIWHLFLFNIYLEKLPREV